MIENAVILMPTISWGNDMMMMPYSDPFLPIWVVMLLGYGSPILGMALAVLYTVWEDRQKGHS